MACLDLARAGRGVDAALAALLVLEMLDGIGDVDARAIDAGFAQRTIKLLDGRVVSETSLAA